MAASRNSLTLVSSVSLWLQLLFQLQGISPVFQLEYPGSFFTPRGVGSVEGDAEASVKGVEYHSMSPVLGEEGLLLLSPGARYFSGKRFGYTDRVFSVHETGPDHQQLACFGAIKKAAIGHMGGDLKIIMQGAR